MALSLCDEGLLHLRGYAEILTQHLKCTDLLPEQSQVLDREVTGSTTWRRRTARVGRVGGQIIAACQRVVEFAG